MKKPVIHPADERDAAIIAGAVRFDVKLFRGAGQYDSGTAAALADAVALGREIAKATGNKRPALIYAVNAKGEAALVTRAQQAAMLSGSALR